MTGKDRQTINKKDLQAIAQAAAKNIKAEEDLNEFRQILTKITVEAALNAEFDDHLGMPFVSSKKSPTPKSEAPAIPFDQESETGGYCNLKVCAVQ